LDFDIWFNGVDVKWHDFGGSDRIRHRMSNIPWNQPKIAVVVKLWVLSFVEGKQSWSQSWFTNDSTSQTCHSTGNQSTRFGSFIKALKCAWSSNSSFLSFRAMSWNLLGTSVDSLNKMRISCIFLSSSKISLDYFVQSLNFT
jgi:hypothetical protein